jgi:hypothetical protein
MGNVGLGCPMSKPIGTGALIKALLTMRTCGPIMCCLIKGEKKKVKIKKIRKK